MTVSFLVQMPSKICPVRLPDASQHRQSIDTLRCEAYVSNMKANFVSLHPYFKVHPGKLEAVKAGFPRFVEKTAIERKNLFYGFTINGDEILCREGYIDADGVLAHLDNVGVLLAEMLKIADLTRVEVRPGGRARKAKRTSRASQSGVVRARGQPYGK